MRLNVTELVETAAGERDTCDAGGSAWPGQAREVRRVALAPVARWMAVGMAAAVLVLLGALVRLTPHSPFYPIPGGYRAFSVYDIRHILQTGHEIRLGERHNVTSYSSGIYLGTEDILRHKVDASIMLLLGLGPGNLAAYYKYALWSPLIGFPLAVLAVYSALCRASGRRVTIPAALALVAFSVMGSFNMVSVTPHGETNTATGWTFMLVAIYGLLCIPENPVRGRMLFFTFSALVILLYHTSALVLASAVVMVGLFEVVRAHVERRSGDGAGSISHSATTMGVVALFVLTYFMYVSVSFFRLFAKTVARAPSLIDYLLRQQGASAPRDALLQGLLSRGDAAFFREEAVLAILVALPLAVVVLTGLCGRLRAVASDRAVRVTYPWLLGLAPFAIGLFLWSGISGVLWKAGEFGSLFALLALAVLFASRLPRRVTLALYTLVVACVVLTAQLYYSYERHGGAYLTYQEEQAANWLVRHTGQNEAVFTDLRLAAPLIEANHMAVLGINDYDPPQLVREELGAIYYGDNPRAVRPAFGKLFVPAHMKLRYAMFSRRAEQDLPGIKGYDYNFRAAPRDFLRKFRRVPGFSLVYNNGAVQIFEITSPRKGVGGARSST